MPSDNSKRFKNPIKPELLQEAMRVADITQSQVARDAGLAQSYMNGVYHGQIAISASMAIRLEKAIKVVSATDLMVDQARKEVAREKGML